MKFLRPRLVPALAGVLSTPRLAAATGHAETGGHRHLRRFLVPRAHRAFFGALILMALHTFTVWGAPITVLVPPPQGSGADDCANIQKAIDQVQANGGGSVVFAAGTYTLTAASPNDSSTHLYVSNWNANYQIDFIGAASGTTLQTSDLNTILKISGNWQGGTIQGLTFRNNHGVTSGTAMIGLYLIGGAGNKVRNITITGNKFLNFSRHIQICGAQGVDIVQNSFAMEKGRDSGTSTDMEPNVGVWLFSNTNGASINVTVSDNDYDGCSTVTDLGTTTSKLCGDGLIYGSPTGLVARGNRIVHFSFEGIAVAPDPTNGAASLVTANYLDGSPLAGDPAGGGYGIRCDANGAIVDRNTVLNCGNGIFSYSSTYANNIQGLSITNNLIVVGCPAGQQFYSGIDATGVSNSNISSNQIVFSDVANPPATAGVRGAILLSGVNASARLSDGLTVTNNTVRGLLMPATAGSVTAGIYMQWLSNYTIQNNQVRSDLTTVSPQQGKTYGLDVQNMNAPASLQTSNAFLGSFTNPWTIVGGSWQ